MASKVDIPNESTNVRVMKKSMRAVETELISEVLIEEQTWSVFVIQKLSQPPYSIIARELKDFVLKNGELDFLGSEGVLLVLYLKPK